MSEFTKFRAERLAGSIVVSDNGEKGIKLQLQSNDGDLLYVTFSTEVARDIVRDLRQTLDAAER